MGRYLSFNRNTGVAVDGSYPDENFSREMMQLFSIGLFMLNQDGTPIRDAAGKMVDTYTNVTDRHSNLIYAHDYVQKADAVSPVLCQDDIETFSRAWTGYEYQADRVNIETDDKGRNWIDPMLIHPETRDPFPKLDLLGGYIGDGHPLCTGLPYHSWLRRGAKFLYRGPSFTPELMESFDAVLTLGKHSALFQAQ